MMKQYYAGVSTLKYTNIYIRYGDSVDNTIEENSSIFSLIQMRWLPSVRAGGAVKLCTNKILQFLTADASYCRLTCIMAIILL